MPAEPLQRVRRETINHTLAFFAAVRGFNIPGTHPIPHAPRQPSPLNVAILAAAYADAVRDHPHKARQGTKQRLDQIQRHYAPSTLGPLIAHARTDRLLTPTSSGKAGGKLTPKARRILTNAHFHAPWYPPPKPR